MKFESGVLSAGFGFTAWAILSVLFPPLAVIGGIGVALYMFNVANSNEGD